MKGLYSTSDFSLLLYYSIVFIAGFYIIYKFGLNKLSIFIILIFWLGLFDYFDYIGFTNKNIIKIIVFIYAVILFGKNIFKAYPKDKYINSIFILFSAFYWITNLKDYQSILVILSQYSLRYAFPFLVYHGLKDIHTDKLKIFYIKNVLIFIIKVQIILSIIKFFIIGGFMEYIVGSLQFLGGGTAVSLPLIALIFMWIVYNGELKKKEWLFILSIMLIAIVSGKRTPMFMFPLILGLLLTYVKKTIKLKAYLKYAPILLFIFYIGLRSNVTLNPEGKVWGSFDPKFALNYALWYNFGTSDLNDIPQVTTNRGGSLLLLLEPVQLNLKTTNDLIFGHGVTDVVTGENSRFLSTSDKSIQHEGLMGAATIEVYKLGYGGTVLFILMIFFLLFIIKNNKLRNIFILLFIVDFFLYYGSLILNPALAFLFIFTIFYSNYNDKYSYYSKLHSQ